jgi:hypothetical protein
MACRIAKAGERLATTGRDGLRFLVRVAAALMGAFFFFFAGWGLDFFFAIDICLVFRTIS